MAAIQKVPLTAPDVSSKVAAHLARQKNGGASSGHSSPTPEEIASHGTMQSVITDMKAK